MRPHKQTCKYFTELQKFNCNVKLDTILVGCFLLTRPGEQSFIFKTQAKVRERLLLLQQKQFKLTLNVVFIFAHEASGAILKHLLIDFCF